MSIIETLTEGIVNRDMKKEGSALLSKWTKTGLLEGLQNEQQKHTMARLLENQAKELLRESSSMGAGDVEGFAAVAFPIVRRVFAGLIANDLVSVQPMSLPSGLIFFLDFVYSDSLGTTTEGARFGNNHDESIYGTNRVASQVTGGVSLVGDQKQDLSGPRGMTGYAYGSPTGSLVALASGQGKADAALVSSFILDGNISEENKKLIQYDPDLLAITDSSLDVMIVDIDKATHHAGGADFNNLSAFAFNEIVDGANISNGVVQFLNGFASISSVVIGTLGQVRRLTTIADATSGTNKSELGSNVAAVRYVFTTEVTQTEVAKASAEAMGSVNLAAGALQFPLQNTIPIGGAVGSVQSSDSIYGLEGSADIPEIDIKVDSIAITAQTKKLKAKWTPELGQDLNAYHNLDAEVELTSILSEQIALEIDREILADLVNGAKAGTFYWSRSPGLFVNRVTGAEIGQTSAAPDFTGTVSEWYETLIETMNDVSAQIHRKTLRGGANFCVVSPEVANILEFTAGFRANVTADADKGEIGAVKIGSLSRKFDVIVDPYFPRNVVLMGRKGNSFLESGYVYAPYVPLQTTPTIFGVEDFVPRKGVMTRYAKKMVRPDMYGLVIVRGLLGEAGATS